MQENANHFVDLVRLRAEQFSDKVAYRFIDGTGELVDQLSYGALQQRSQVFAETLLHRLSQGDRVLLAFPAGLDFIVAFYACLRAGVIAVPVSPPSRNKIDTKLLSVIADSEPALILSHQSLADSFEATFAELSSQAPAVHFLNHLELSASASTNNTAQVSLTKDSLALLQYTSGSTGTPKGVMISHGNLMHNSGLINHETQAKSSERGVMWLPFFHDMGLVGTVLQPLFAGGEVTFMAPLSFLKNPFLWLQTITERGAHLTAAPNFALQHCIDKITDSQRAELDLSTLRTLLCGAEPVDAATVKRFCRVFADTGLQYGAVLPCFGMAETTLYVSGTSRKAGAPVTYLDRAALVENRVEITAQGPDAQALIGNGVVPDTVRIVDTQSGAVLGESTVGEIYVSGGSVAQGYWNKPAQSAEVFALQLPGISDRDFMRTGDLGIVINDELYVAGREKDLVIIRGKNHYPQDIEQNVSKVHPDLLNGACAAFSIEQGNDRGEGLMVVQEVSRSGVRLFKDERAAASALGSIRAALNDCHALIPAVIVLLRPGRLPKTSSGKVQRRATRAAWLDGTLDGLLEWRRPTNLEAAQESASLHSREEIELWLINRIAKRAGMENYLVELNLPFANYGLDSLAAVELVDELNRALVDREPIDVTELWNYPTVQSLLDFLDQPETNTGPTQAKATEPTEEPGSLEDEVARLAKLLGD